MTLARLLVVAVAAVGVCLPALAAQEFEPAPSDLAAKEIARRADDAYRSDRTYSKGRMIVTSPRLTRPREIVFRSWEDRPTRRSFIRILEPAKDAGSGFLMEFPNLWMYVPRVERTMRVPPSMMLQSWMGSDFTNDDLVRGSNTVEDYEHTLLGIDPSPPGGNGRRAYVVDFVPHEDAPVVWGRLRMWVDVEWLSGIRTEFYDEEGELLRVLQLGDIRPVGERFVPHAWRIEPTEKPGHRTEMFIEEIEFDAEFGDDIFTTRNLKRGK